MKFLLPVLTALLLVNSAAIAKKKPSAALEPNTEIADTTVYKLDDPAQQDAVESLPVFKGKLATKSFSQWCQSRVKYPPKAGFYNIQGRVVCSLIVEPDGSLSNINIVRGAHPLLNKEVLRVVKSYPRGHWEPATCNGKPVRCMITVPISFKMEL